MRQWPERRARRARIEIIPMIDVMMFLLVFFVLVSINVLPALGLRIAPPTSSKPDKVVRGTHVTVGIDYEGNIFLDGKPISLADLPARLKPAPGEQPPSVLITGDQAAGLQALVSVLDALKAANIASAQIVTKPK